MRPIAFYKEVFEDPALDIAVSRALIDIVADGFPYDTLRINQPSRMLALGKLDRFSDGFGRVIDHCRDNNLTPVIRIAGGRAAAFDDGTLALAWARKEPAGMLDIQERLRPLNEIYIDSFSGLGVDAREGELPGEYCPGASTINSRGQVKLVGTGQRAIKGVGHLGSVIAAEQGWRLKEILQPIYKAMDHPFDSNTCGSIDDEITNINSEQVIASLLASFADRHSIEEQPLPEEVVERAHDLVAQHRIDYSTTQA